MMKLFGYWRSSASFRVRIALNLKNIEVEHISVNLRDGAQYQDKFSQLSPQSFVPILQLEDGTRLLQSQAIIEYLDSQYSGPALLPADEIVKAKVRAGFAMIASDIAPIQNLRVLKYVKSELQGSDEIMQEWAHHWIDVGLTNLEKFVQLENSGQDFLFTQEPGLAECALLPQLYNAKRFKVDVSKFPKLLEVQKRCNDIEAFVQAEPEKQLDALK